MKCSNKVKGFSAILVLIFCAFVIVISTLLIKTYFNKLDRNLLTKDYSGTQNTELVDKYQALVGQTVLVDKIENFSEDYYLSDLPNSSDIRNTGIYKDHSILITTPLIIDYSAKTGVINRTSLGRMFIVYSGAVIGNYVYAAVNGDPIGTQPNLTFGPSHIILINLDTGRVDKVIDTSLKFGSRMGNPWIASDGTNLWISSVDGVYKYDTEADTFKSYTPQQTKLSTWALRILNKQGNIILLNQQYETASVYDPKTDTWTIDASKYQEPSVSNNLFPGFSSVSQSIGDIYYLVSNNSYLYSLNSTGFPVKQVKLNLLDTNYLNSKFYMSPDKTFLILSYSYYGPDFINTTHLIDVKRIDLPTGLVTDLKSNEMKLQETYPNSLALQALRNGVPFIYKRVSDNILQVIDGSLEGKTWGKAILEIDLKKNLVTLPNLQ